MLKLLMLPLSAARRMMRRRSSSSVVTLTIGRGIPNRHVVEPYLKQHGVCAWPFAVFTNTYRMNACNQQYDQKLKKNFLFEPIADLQFCVVDLNATVPNIAHQLGEHTIDFGDSARCRRNCSIRDVTLLCSMQIRYVFRCNVKDRNFVSTFEHTNKRQRRSIKPRPWHQPANSQQHSWQHPN